MKKLYLFDFDGTLTEKDTLFLFLRFSNPKEFKFQFLKHIPLFILVKLQLSDAETVKKHFIASLLKGKTKTFLEKKAQEFFDIYYPKIFREKALEFFENINRENTESIIVTASLDIWVKPFAEKLGMILLATQAEFENDIFTGNFSTPNCNGKEKVIRIKQEISGKKYDKIIAFGDTSGDKAMLNFSDESHYEFFH